MKTYILSFRTPVYTTLRIKAEDVAEAEKKAYDFAVHGENRSDVQDLSEEWMPHDFMIDTLKEEEQ